MIERCPAFLAVLISLHTTLHAATYYCATNGDDANPGTEISPFYSVGKAIAFALPGDTIFMHGGTYDYRTNIVSITKSGAAGAPISVWAYTNSSAGDEQRFYRAEVK